jgi:hypothetical protein
VAKPYWTDSEEKKDAWLRLAGVVVLTLGSTGAPALMRASAAVPHLHFLR